MEIENVKTKRWVAYDGKAGEELVKSLIQQHLGRVMTADEKKVIRPYPRIEDADVSKHVIEVRRQI